MIKLLEENKLVTKSLQEWFTNKMKDAIAQSENEEWKEHFIESEISIEKLAPVLELNPRVLFDFFDQHAVYILPVMEGNMFSAMIDGEPISLPGFTSDRITAEKIAVEDAFPILEKILSNLLDVSDD